MAPMTLFWLCTPDSKSGILVLAIAELDAWSFEGSVSISTRALVVKLPHTVPVCHKHAPALHTSG